MYNEQLVIVQQTSFITHENPFQVPALCTVQQDENARSHLAALDVVLIGITSFN
jgi:hypothetical protein